MPHLLPRHTRHEPSDAETLLSSVSQQVSLRVLVQVVHELEQEHVSAVSDAVGGVLQELKVKLIDLIVMENEERERERGREREGEKEGEREGEGERKIGDSTSS